MFNWLRNKLGITDILERSSGNAQSLILLHKRMDKLETDLGWKLGLSGPSGISQGREPDDPDAIAESNAIGDKVLASFRAAFPPKPNLP